MKPTTAFTICVLVLFISAKAQKPGSTFNNYWYLQSPTSNVFFSGFTKPDGKDDPSEIATDVNFTADDLDINTGAFKQTDTSTKSSNNSFLVNIWVHKGGLSIAVEYDKIKHVKLKNDSWGKIDDHEYHVVEGLRADSVTLTISKSNADTVGSGFLQKIASLFVGGKTVFGNILSVLGKNDSTSKNQSSLVQLKDSGKNKITMIINDSSVYYAVRYVKVGNADYPFAWNGKYKAPDYKAGPADSETITKTLAPQQTIISLLENPRSQILNYVIKMNFAYEPQTSIAHVYITGSKITNAAPGAKPKQAPDDTLYSSEPIDFKNEFANQPYNDFYRFGGVPDAEKHDATNTLICCEYNIRFDPATRTLKILNYPLSDHNYHTFISTQTADISFYPR